MNRFALIVKDKTAFSSCYRSLYLLPSQNIFYQSCKHGLSLELAHRESLITLSHERHASFVSRMKEKLKNKFANSTKVRIAGNLVYEKIADDVDYQSFCKSFQLTDSFQTWFLCIQVHVWMVLVTTISERHGREFRNAVIDSMWNDVEIRMGHLANLKSSAKKKYLEQLVSQFQAALVSYDEGILSDDTVLASAAWRTLFAFKLVDPELLENFVIYIRRQLAHLDSVPIEKIMFQGSISFLPFHTVLAECKE